MFQHKQGTLSVHATRVSWRKHSRQTRCLTSSTSRSYRHSGLAEARLSSHAPRNCAGVLYASPTEAHTHEFKLCACRMESVECSGRGVSVTVTQQREKTRRNSAFAFMPSFILSCLFYVPALAARPWEGSEGWGAPADDRSHHPIRLARFLLSCTPCAPTLPPRPWALAARVQPHISGSDFGLHATKLDGRRTPGHERQVDVGHRSGVQEFVQRVLVRDLL